VCGRLSLEIGIDAWIWSPELFAWTWSPSGIGTGRAKRAGVRIPALGLSLTDSPALRTFCEVTAVKRCLILLVFVLSLSGPYAQTAEQAPCPPGSPFHSQALGLALSQYLAHRDTDSWQALFSALGTYLADPARGQVTASQLLAVHPGMAELKPSVLEAGTGRLWYFSGRSDSTSFLVQWQPASTARGRPYGIKVQALALPSRTTPLQASVVTSSSKTEPPARYLILASQAVESTAVVLSSWRLVSDTWKETREPFAGLPRILLDNLSGQVSFSGADLVFSIKRSTTEASHSPQSVSSKPPASERLVLRLAGGRYVLEGRRADDTPFNIAYQFLDAVQTGKLTLARSWLAEPTLINLPRYLGLANRKEPVPIRILNMASPRPGVFRFRFVTFDRNDLILDVGKEKERWLVKAIYIAPADRLIQNITQALPADLAGQAGARAISTACQEIR